MTGAAASEGVAVKSAVSSRLEGSVATAYWRNLLSKIGYDGMLLCLSSCLGIALALKTKHVSATIRNLIFYLCR
jgi:hypothetical protein